MGRAHLDLVGLWRHRRCSPAGALRKLGRLFAQDLLAPMPRCSQTSLSRLLSHFVPCSPTLFLALPLCSPPTLTLSHSHPPPSLTPLIRVCVSVRTRTRAHAHTRTVTHLHTAWAHRARTQGPHRDDTGTWATSWGGGGGAPLIASPPAGWSPLALLRCTLDCRVSSEGPLPSPAPGCAAAAAAASVPMLVR